MPNRDAQQPEIQLDKLGGLNQRPALNATPSPDFPVLHALYQRRSGSLQRLEGTQVLASVPDAIMGGAQLDDSTGNVIVETEDGTEYLYTLAELFGRTVVSNLNYTPLPPDEDMATAIIIQDTANGVDLADIGGATANTWYTRALTSNPLNEDGIILSFTAGTSASFDIAPGTYRVRGFVTAALTLTVASGALLNTAKAGFQAVLVDVTTSTTVAVSSAESVEFQRPTNTNPNCNFGPVNSKALFDTTFVIAGPGNSTLQLKNACSQTLTGSNATVVFTGGNAANVTTTINGAAVRQPFVSLNISKVA